jgi:heme/copper-type cytochrome/quinol oxidase subunit 4
MIYLSKKQRKTVIILLAVCLIVFQLIDFFGDWFFDFDISSSVGIAVVTTLALAICGVNLIYYWWGEGAADRDRSDSLRMLVASAVILVVILGFYLWFD